MKKQTLKAKLTLHRETLHTLDAQALEILAGGANSRLRNQCYTEPSACPQNCKP
jgi:hypothetical protein